MAKFKGKNDNKTSMAQAVFRAQYQGTAFERTSLDGRNTHESIVDFNVSELRYYGKIDHEHDPVVINNNALQRINISARTNEEVKLICTPVHRMFADLQRKLRQGALVGLSKIDVADPFLANPQVFLSHKDPIVEYREYLAELLEAFNEVFLAERSDNITNIHQYVKEFLNYSETLKSDFPITLTGWRKSKHSSLMSTGIALTIADLDCSVDEDTEKFILDKNCETYYYQACKQYGFSMTKKCPWVLVADLASVATRRYLTDSGVSGVNNFFNQYYTKTYMLDIDLLRPMIRNSYVEFINNNSYIKDINICNNNLNKLTSKNIYRKPITRNDYNRDYGDYFWIPYYVRMRNIEDEVPYNEPSLVRIIEKASQFEKLLDKEKAMSYINEQFRKKYKYAHGSAYYYSRRLKAKKRLEG